MLVGTSTLLMSIVLQRNVSYRNLLFSQSQARKDEFSQRSQQINIHSVCTPCVI